MFAKSRDAVAREDTEDISLVIVKLRRSVAAEAQKIVAKEGLHASERQMGEFRTMVQQNVDALEQCQYAVVQTSLG